ncbi:hypothetical protein TNCV_4735031 [Trichonephila clavipes]|nr:hypothetical protein TNCV_4735031 [Trichonephila clavipes]
MSSNRSNHISQIPVRGEVRKITDQKGIWANFSACLLMVLGRDLALQNSILQPLKVGKFNWLQHFTTCRYCTSAMNQRGHAFHNDATLSH